jgi:hypothetical protein
MGTPTTERYVPVSVSDQLLNYSLALLDHEPGQAVTEVDELTKPWPPMKQPPYLVIALSVAYLTVAVVGLVNNGLVVAVVFAQSHMRTVTNCFLANLATADILVCLLVLPITLLQNVYTGRGKVCVR